MVQVSLSEDVRNRVFVSYSRRDLFFAQRLVDALTAHRIHAYLDIKDIVPGEDWRARLEGLIREADAVLFVISPDSVAGWQLPQGLESVCAWEIRRSLELGKQLVPILWRKVPVKQILLWVFRDFDPSNVSAERVLMSANLIVSLLVLARLYDRK